MSAIKELESARAVLEELRNAKVYMSQQQRFYFENVISQLERHDRSFRPKIPESPLFTAPEPSKKGGDYAEID